jgi:3-deoxy-D-arabino-heptulosonate 7-phosphate (DAHP) synthase
MGKLNHPNYNKVFLTRNGKLVIHAENGNRPAYLVKINGKNVYAESPNYNATPVLAARANMNRYVFRRNEGRNLQALGGRGYREYGNFNY